MSDLRRKGEKKTHSAINCFFFKYLKIHFVDSEYNLGAVHILRQPSEGGGGVSQKLTIADEGGCGSDKFSRK